MSKVIFSFDIWAMGLLTKVLAGAVSSLSDARYFAGMGVDWIGFDVNPESEAYVNPELYKNIAGWVSGPKRVVEISSSSQTIPEVIEAYAPDYIQVPIEYVSVLNNNDLPVLATTNTEKIDFGALGLIAERMEYLILDWPGQNPFHHSTLLAQISKHVNLLWTIEPQISDVRKIISELPIAGLALRGSKEIKSGLKDYGYSALLECLDDDQ